jgi:hypothetical protein
MRLRELMKASLWPVLPKPWNSQDMEFHYGLWLGVSALFSESGRQLGEENTRPFVLNHHLPAETIACKYEGSRNGRSINMSALRTAMQNFGAALAITKAVQSHHISRKDKQEPLGLWDLYILSRASIALIAYSVRCRAENRANGSVSDALTSQFQFISGVFMICRHMMENANSLISQNQPMSAQSLFDYADSNGIFISFNGMACAGSTKKILEFLEFCNDSSLDVDDCDGPLDGIVSEPGNWYQYALATIEFDCFIEQERMRRLDQEQSRPDRIRAAMIYEAVGDYVQSLMESSGLCQMRHTSFEDGALARQNRILDILGRKRIRKLPPRHVMTRLK